MPTSGVYGDKILPLFTIHWFRISPNLRAAGTHIGMWDTYTNP